MGAPNLAAGEAVLAAIPAQSVPETSLHTWAWEPIEQGIAGLLAGPSESDESNLQIPAVDGRYPYAPTIDQQIVRVPMIITGTHEPDGTEYVGLDPGVGLRRNIVLFRSWVTVQVATSAGTRTLTLTTIDTAEADIVDAVQVLPFQIQQTYMSAWEVVVPIVVPSGGFGLGSGS